MRQTITNAIVLQRTNFGEADRIITLLTSDQGKLRLMVRGARKEKSKLAGGIELFSVSEIGFLRGKGDIATLTTSRLQNHYGKIVNDIDRTMLGYELLKYINKTTEDNAGAEYFNLLVQSLEALNDLSITEAIVRLWFDIQLLEISGHGPNLSKDTDGQELDPKTKYHFDNSKMAFSTHPSGIYGPGHIKLLRLARSNHPKALGKIEDINNYAETTGRLSSSIRKYILHV